MSKRNERAFENLFQNDLKCVRDLLHLIPGQHRQTDCILGILCNFIVFGLLPPGPDFILVSIVWENDYGFSIMFGAVSRFHLREISIMSGHLNVLNADKTCIANIKHKQTNKKRKH